MDRLKLDQGMGYTLSLSLKCTQNPKGVSKWFPWIQRVWNAMQDTWNGLIKGINDDSYKDVNYAQEKP